MSVQKSKNLISDPISKYETDSTVKSIRRVPFTRRISVPLNIFVCCYFVLIHVGSVEYTPTVSKLNLSMIFINDGTLIFCSVNSTYFYSRQTYSICLKLRCTRLFRQDLTQRPTFSD